MNWISVEDRLPEKGEEVLVSRFGIVNFATLEKMKHDNNYYWRFRNRSIKLINGNWHWCEITEPFQQRVIPKVPKEDRAVGK